MIDLTKEKPNFISKVKNTFSFLKNKECLFYYVLLLLGVGFLFYAYMLVQNYFVITYTGDYTIQYLPFAYNYHDDWWTFIKTGVFPYWDSNVFLGADSVTSNGYYIMFSPFFIPLIFVPRSFIPVMLGVISIARAMLAGLFFHYYLKKMGISDKYARIGGLAYAFCGWMAYYQWFNNFLDIVVLLPLILLGIELVLRQKKPWLLALSLGILGIDNFFFFPSIMILCFVYAMFRFFQRLLLNKWSDNLIYLGLGFLGFLFGFMIAFVVFYPGLITGLSDPKVESTSYLKSVVEFFKNGDWGSLIKTLFSWKDVSGAKDTYLTYPIMEMFILPITNRYLTLNKISNFDNMAGSLWVAMPLHIFLIPAIVTGLKEKKFSIIPGIVIIALFLFTPFPYYLLFGGAKAYCRWNIIYPAVVITFIINYLDKHEKTPVWLMGVGSGYVCLGIILSVILSKNYVDKHSYEYFVDPIIVLVLELIYVLALTAYNIVRNYKNKLPEMNRYIIALEAIVIGTLVSIHHGFSNYSKANGGVDNNKALYNAVSEIKKQDSSYYRSYSNLNVQNIANNNQNLNNYNGTAMFNTLYNYNTKYFKWWSRWSDWTGGWSASYVEKRGYLDSFLGIKYYMINDSYDLSNSVNSKKYNVPFEFIEQEDLSNDKVKVFKREGKNIFAVANDDVFTYDFDNAFSSMSGNDFNVLRNDLMYLNNGIISKDDYETIEEEYKSDLTQMDSTITLSEMRTKYGVSHLLHSDFSSTSSPHVKKFYQVPHASKYDVSKLNEIPLNYTPKTREEINQIVSTKSGNLFMFYTNKDASLPIEGYEEVDGLNGAVYYIKANYTQNCKVDIFLLDKEGKIIVADNHDDGYHTNTSKSIRAFYVDEPVYTIVFRPRYYNYSSFDVYAESKANYFKNMNAVLNNAICDANYVDSNTFNFKSNYDKAKYVTTNIAYEKGWEVIANDGNKDIKLNTYLSTGGFVGFVAPKGNLTYRMAYMNPDYKIARYVSLIAISIVSISYVLYFFIKDNRKKELGLSNSLYL